MDYISRFQSIFRPQNFTLSERIKIVESHFEVKSTNLPSYLSVVEFLNTMPKRDKVTIKLIDDSDEMFCFVSTALSDETKYTNFCQNAVMGEIVTVSVDIKKGIEDNCFSVYDYDSFSSDVLCLSFEQVLSAFSALLHNKNHLFIEVFNRDCFFKAKTMVFFSGKSNLIPELLDREKRLQECRDASYFMNLASYSLLPDDFQIDVNFADNPLTELFAKLTTILSLVYISSFASIYNGEIHAQISGQRNVEFSYSAKHISNNPELYKIYHWIFTDGNAIDKALLARNILCLHCKFSELKDIDGKTLASIQSNFNLYLKDNVEKYLGLKNSLAEFIRDVISKTGDYATQLLSSFKVNLLAIFGFLFTVVLANIVSDQPLENIFTKDITAILEIVLAGSFVYLAICFMEIKYKLKKVEGSYDALKDNYESVLSEVDLQEIFNEDKLINNARKSVKRGIRLYTALWSIFLLIALIVLESISSRPIIITWVKQLLGI